MSLIIFDTHLGAQGREDICELEHCLVSFLSQRGPFCVQVVITYNMVVLFLNSILNKYQVTMTVNNKGSSVSFCSQKVSHQYLTWGMTLRSAKVIFSLFEKLWTKKYPSSRFNHLSITSASIWPSNIGITKLICTLKGAIPLFEEDALPVGSR